MKRNKTYNAQNLVESSSDDDSDYDIGESNRRPVATMSDLDYIHKNVISTEKPFIEPVPIPRRAAKAENDNEEESSEDESEDEGGRIDLQKESSVLHKLLSDNPSAGNSKGEYTDDDDKDNDEDEMKGYGDVDGDDDGEGESTLPPKTKNEVPFLDEPIQVDNEETMKLLGMLREGAEARKTSSLQSKWLLWFTWARCSTLLWNLSP